MPIWKTLQTGINLEVRTSRKYHSHRLVTTNLKYQFHVEYTKFLYRFIRGWIGVGLSTSRSLPHSPAPYMYLPHPFSVWCEHPPFTKFSPLSLLPPPHPLSYPVHPSHNGTITFLIFENKQIANPKSVSIKCYKNHLACKIESQIEFHNLRNLMPSSQTCYLGKLETSKSIDVWGCDPVIGRTNWGNP